MKLIPSSRKFVLINLMIPALLLLAAARLAPAATFTVTTSAESGAGSLRQAIIDANSNSGPDTIDFNIGGGGAQTITMTIDFPRIVSPVVIDATTQPGFGGAPIIELKGPGIQGNQPAFAIEAGSSTIRGFIISGFNLGAIAIYTNGGNVVENNYIGTNSSGTAARPNFGAGIDIFDSSNNRIGGTTAAARNLISGNGGAGILINGTNAANNVIQGNYIGTNIGGTAALPNQREGICLCSSNGDFSVNNNLVGGTTAGAGNLISGNASDEIRISGFASANSVKGNRIGTNSSGTSTISSSGYGIYLSGVSGNTIGGAAVGAGNVIAGSFSGSSGGGTGIEIERSSGNVIQGNAIGTDLAGTSSLPNLQFGITIFENSQNNVIGGTAAGEGNIIAFNGRSGILVSNSSANPLPVVKNSIRGNSIFSNGELGIDLATDTGTGVTPNDPCDADTGNNNQQNFPVLTGAVRVGNLLRLNGTLNSAANTGFWVDVYASPSADPTGFGEGRVYLGTIALTTDGSCNGTFNGVLPVAGSGQFISATATDTNGNTSEFSADIAVQQGLNHYFDFDGDGKTDISIFRPSNGEWWYVKSSTGGVAALRFGAAGDRILPVDFTGDGRTDPAFYRPSTGEWFALRSEDGSYFSFPFGALGITPAPADYDGDGKADAAFFDQSSGSWWLNYSTGGGAVVSFGAAGDKPVPADYDGDGKTDIAIFRPSDGSWWILRSSDGDYRVYSFGAGTDRPVPGDWTGDGKADLAVWRPSTGFWYVQRSEDDSYFSFPFGAAGDIPAPGDYDGDGKFDPAVFRPSTATWYVNRTTAGLAIVSFGAAGDQPVPSAFAP